MVVTKKISLQSKGHCDIIDITPEVEQQIAEAEINNGTVTLFVAGSTAGITTIEFEPGAAGVMAMDTHMSVLHYLAPRW